VSEGRCIPRFLGRTGVDACASWQLWRSDRCDAQAYDAFAHLDPEIPINLLLRNIYGQVRNLNGLKSHTPGRRVFPNLASNNSLRAATPERSKDAECNAPPTRLRNTSL
jgi:hypothetical protein